MAYNYTTQTDGVGVPFNYTRGNPIPLDSWSLFMSYSDAETYAKTNPVSYPGQVLTVITNGSPVVYTIAAGTNYKDGDDIPEGKKIGDEIAATRTLIQLGTKAEIEAASASAVMNWLNDQGQEIEG